MFTTISTNRPEKTNKQIVIWRSNIRDGWINSLKVKVDGKSKNSHFSYVLRKLLRRNWLLITMEILTLFGFGNQMLVKWNIQGISVGFCAAVQDRF